MGLLSDYLRKARLKKIRDYISGNVLDLSCGPAYSYNYYNDRIENYYATEYSEKQVEELRYKFPKTKIFQKDLDKDTLVFDIKFDTVLLLAVIEHIFNQKHLMQQVLKNLHPNGNLVITTPTPFGNDYIHKIGSVIGLFNKNGGIDDHIVIYNKQRLILLANEFDLEILKYKKFQLGCNQLIILKKK